MDWFGGTQDKRNNFLEKNIITYTHKSIYKIFIPFKIQIITFLILKKNILSLHRTHENNNYIISNT